MSFELVIATRNAGKLKEIKKYLNHLEVNLSCLKDYPHLPEIVEDGDSFEANARKKAVVVAKYTGKLSLADDSGLEIDYLNGAPGISSARFGGNGLTDRQRSERILALLDGVPMEERTARFRAVIAIAEPDGRVKIVEGKCEGEISLEIRGKSGFGYDPIFMPAGYNQTFAELGIEIKNRLSHRGEALRKVMPILIELRREDRGS